MVSIKLEIWMRLGNDLGKDFHTPSETCSIWEHEVEDGTTVRIFFDYLAESYQPIRERIFQKAKSSFYPDIVVTLNDRVINTHELNDKVLMEGDKIAVLPIFTGG